MSPTCGIKNNVVSPVMLWSYAGGVGRYAPDANINARRTNNFDESDGDSRFSDVDLSRESEEDMEEWGWGAKRGRTNNVDESNGDSRFSDVDPSRESEEDMEERGRGAKRGSPSSLADSSPYAAFWSVDLGHIQFMKRAFMTKSLFHLKSMVVGKEKRNRACSVFLREGVAMGGW